MVHFGPFWPKEVYFGPFRSANRTLATLETPTPTPQSFFTCDGGTGILEDQTHFPDAGNHKQERPNPIFGRGAP